MNDPAWAAIATLTHGGHAYPAAHGFAGDFAHGTWLTPDEQRRLATGGPAAISACAADCAASCRFPWKRLAASTPGGFEAAVADRLARLRLRAGSPLALAAFPRGAPVSGFRGAAGAMFPVGFDGSPPGFGALVHPPSDYETMDVLVDWFQEPARLAARRADARAAPLDMWSDPKFVARALTAAAPAFDAHSVRETLMQMRDWRECTQWKPSLGVALISMLGGGKAAPRILDPSAGWGDRLAAAAAAGAGRYLGFDPNPALAAGHAALAAAAAPAAAARFEVVRLPFEGEAAGAVLAVEVETGGPFDLVMTSPPFFDFEIYSSAPGQSVAAHPTVDGWLVEFLFASLARAWDALAPGGHLALHLSDGRFDAGARGHGPRVCEATCLFVEWQCTGARYRGTIGDVGESGRPRPVFIWARDAGPGRRAARAGAAMLTLFPALHAQIVQAKK